MGRIGVLGADGFLGRLVVAEFARRGQRVEALGGVELARDEAALARAVAACSLVVCVLGRRGITRRVLEVAARVGTHLVDVVGDPATLRWAVDHRQEQAQQAGVTVVLAGGMPSVPGDPLAHLAAQSITAAREVHVCYAVPSAGGALRALSGGSRVAIGELLGAPATVLSDGELVEELPGEARRLAWFPRPIGPAHAAGVPGPEAMTVPRHVPSARTVRTYLALSSWRAELLQASSGLAARPAGRRWLERRLTSRRGGPSAPRRAATRWACVAEAAGEEGVARAWAYGTDPYGTSAASLVALAMAVQAGHADAGVVPPSLVEVPADLLDDLSAGTDLRWSVSRPSAHGSAG